jgi:hypothetical protein
MDVRLEVQAGSTGGCICCEQLHKCRRHNTSLALRVLYEGVWVKYSNRVNTAPWIRQPMRVAELEIRNNEMAISLRRNYRMSRKPLFGLPYYAIANINTKKVLIGMNCS